MNSLRVFKNFVDEINAKNARNYKIAVLTKYRDNEEIKQYLRFVFDPYIVFGISEKKLNKSILLDPVKIWSDDTEFDFLDLLNWLSEHNTGKDSDLAVVKTFKFQFIEAELFDLFDKIITKNLQLGVTATTINKIMPKLIREFNVMLANKYFDKPEIVEGREFVLTTKIDGMRCVMIKENDAVTFWSRQGQQIEGLVELEAEALDKFPNGIVLDGELIAKNTDKANTYKNTMQLARTKDTEKRGLKMMVFDITSVDGFKEQCFPISYTQRRRIVEKVFSANSNWSNFELLPVLYSGKDTTMITKILDEQVDKGEEGIMINLATAAYDFKRTNNLLKCKKFNDCDLKVVGFEEGTNRNAGKLGAIICEYKDSTVKVGSGYTDEQRIEFWANKEQLLNKIITVKYFEESTNADGGKSLRFPIFVDFRDPRDKTTPDF